MYSFLSVISGKVAVNENISYFLVYANEREFKGKQILFSSWKVGTEKKLKLVACRTNEFKGMYAFLSILHSEVIALIIQFLSHMVHMEVCKNTYKVRNKLIALHIELYYIGEKWVVKLLKHYYIAEHNG